MIAFLTSLSLLWLIGIPVLITIAILLEKEEIEWTASIFIVGLALLLIKFDGFKYIAEHPSNIALFSIGYILIGILWSIIKWYFYTNKYFIGVKGVKDEFNKNYGELTKENVTNLNTMLNGLGYNHWYRNTSLNKTEILKTFLDNVVPKAKDKKALIISWLTYWPVSLLATLLNNPFRKIFEWIYNNISGAYDKMTSKRKNNILNN